MLKKNNSKSLLDLTDVDVSNKVNGYALQYDSTSGKFKSQALPTGIGTGASITNAYIIELTRWGISNTGINAILTTQGINNALVWASQNGYTYVKLPAGTYLVGAGTKEIDSSVGSCILPQNDTVLDLYGCTIQKETNGWEGYSTVLVLDKKNVTILGGKVVGDYLTHNYTSSGIHEGAIGIKVAGSDNVVLDGIDVSGFPGYSTSLTSGSGGGQVAVTAPADWESGTISQTDGSLVTNTGYMRMNKFITLASMKYQVGSAYAAERGTDITGNFYIWGNGHGAYATRTDGRPANFATVVFEVHFYDDVNVYKGVILRRGFDEIKTTDVPAGATRFKISLHYDIRELIQSTIFVMIQSMRLSRGIRVLNCKIHDGFALAIAITGAQHVLIEQCELYNIGFSTLKIGRKLYPAPMGIDCEDLTNANQHITVRSCLFRNNENLHMSIVQARNVTIEHNKFDPCVGASTGVVFQGTRGTSNVSQFNTYTGCVAVGEGGMGFLLFNRDNFINGNMIINNESIYDGCIFDNSTLGLAMDTITKFSASSAYVIGDSVLPTTLNGFYYVCIAKTVADTVVQPEPNWSLALAEGSQFTANGFTWRASTYDPIYSLAMFKDCKFNFDRPEVLSVWLQRRGRAEFNGCKFDIITTNGFFSDSSDGWDYIGNNEWSFKDCEFMGRLGGLGGVLGKKISFANSRFRGTSDSTAVLAGFTADDLYIYESIFENYTCTFRGRANTNIKNLRFVNNIYTMNKSVRTYGNETEGIIISNFDNTFIERNKFFMKNASVLNRPLSIRAEKIVKITDNHFESVNPSNVLELFSVYRTGAYAGLPIPTTIEIFDKNYTIKFAPQKDAAYVPQVVRTIGDGFTVLS